MLAVHGSGVRYSRGPNVNTPLFHVRQYVRRFSMSEYKAPVCTARVVLVARQTTTYPSLSTYYFHLKMESGRRKWRNYVHSYTYPADGGRRTAHVPNQCMLVLSQRKWVHFWRRLDTWLTTRLYPRSLEYLAFFGLACWLVVLRVFKPKIELFVLLVFPFRFILNSKRVKALTFAFYITHTTLRTALWKER